MAQPLVIGGETFKRRNPFGVWLGLPLITLGIYFFVYWYKINNEARRYLRDPSITPGVSLLAVLLGWILILPPFVTAYTTAGRVRRMQEQAGIPDRCEPWLALFLRFIWGLDVLYLQFNLNKVWDAYLRAGPGPYPPMRPPGASGYPSWPRGDGPYPPPGYPPTPYPYPPPPLAGLPPYPPPGHPPPPGSPPPR